MEPRVKWSMATYRSMQDVIASGEGQADTRSSISAMMGDFEKDIAEGWAPPSGEKKAPATRTAQEVGIGGEYDPSTMRGQLSQELQPSALPDPEIDDDLDTLESAEARERAPTLYDESLRSASHQKSLYADPIYTPDAGEIELETQGR